MKSKNHMEVYRGRVQDNRYYTGTKVLVGGDIPLVRSQDSLKASCFYDNVP
jgi:hypothetical protein